MAGVDDAALGLGHKAPILEPSDYVEAPRLRIEQDGPALMVFIQAAIAGRPHRSGFAETLLPEPAGEVEDLPMFAVGMDVDLPQAAHRSKEVKGKRYHYRALGQMKLGIARMEAHPVCRWLPRRNKIIKHFWHSLSRLEFDAMGKD